METTDTDGSEASQADLNSPKLLLTLRFQGIIDTTAARASIVIFVRLDKRSIAEPFKCNGLFLVRVVWHGKNCSDSAALTAGDDHWRNDTNSDHGLRNHECFRRRK